MKPAPLHSSAYRETVARALTEDVGSGDITTNSVVDKAREGTAQILAREPLVLCGLPVMREVFSQVDPKLSFTGLMEEGSTCKGPRQPVARVSGSLASILTAERVALNFAQRMSGIATLCREFCSRVGPEASARLVDTRKTTPGLRHLEKYAVRVGGARNHRFGLDDGLMIKDNHIAAAGGIAEAVRRAPRHGHHLLRIQVEVESLKQAIEAAEAGAGALLLDNFSVEELRNMVETLRREAPGVLLEASGGVSLETVAAIAETGVDVISCGAITHQSRAVDLSLQIEAL